MYRGKRIETGEWVYGYYYHDSVFDGDYIMAPPKNSGLIHLIDYEVHPASVGQWTGLKDKNGKEIYCGDVVRAKTYGMIEYDIKSVIDFEKGCFGIRALQDEALCDSKGKFRSFDGCNTEINIEIITNTTDTPDLLKAD
jgi:uncharacterized phage protein (TIGR01671 family)